MIKRLLPSFAAALLLIMSACSTNKLAQQGEQVDDVYYTEAQAKEYSRTYVQAEEKQESQSEYVTDEELYGDDDYGYYNRDYDYSARIYRFRNYSPWRGYYDTWYDYRFDPYYSNFTSYNYYNRPGFGIHIGLGHYGYNNYYNPWNYYGSQYYGNYWGPYSYYNSFNRYGYGNPYYGNYGGGYYGNTGRPVVVDPNYRSRPNRETENIRSGVNQGSRDRINAYPTRPERNSNGSSDRVSTVDRSSQPARTNSRPSRGSDSRPASVERNTTRSSTPQRTERSEPAPRPERTESRPAERQESSQPSSTPQRSSDQGSSSRPSRTGGR